MTMTTSEVFIGKKIDKFSGYQPRHISIIEEDFCIKGCMIVDGVKVPFPDCVSHGNPFTKK
jgi:hypothetical protein